MEDLKLSVQIKKYFQWPFILSAVFLVMLFIFFLSGDYSAGLIGAGFLTLYLALLVAVMMYRQKRITAEMVSFAMEFDEQQRILRKEFVLPYAHLDLNGNVLWMNDEFMEASGRDNSFHKNIQSVFPELTRDKLPTRRRRTECVVTSGDKVYRAAMQRFSARQGAGETESLIGVYLFDETELTNLIDEKNDNRLVFGLLSLDNYDEALETVDELRKSLFLALIERKINKYFAELDGFVRKTEKDKYFFIIRKKGLDEMESKRFSILEDVRSVNVGNEMSMTISIGIAYGTDSLIQSAEAARSAIDIALGRGGDQVVVKEGYNTRYFGGKTETTEKYTRVKARVKAHALKEIMVTKQNVLIMGHKIPDVDALGAAVGIWRCAATIGRPAHIVMDNPPESIREMVNGFRNNPDYDSRMFVTIREAMEMVGPESVVVVVDTNKPSYTECEDLLYKETAIVVLDHHRQGKDIIQNATLSYIEPYASSACEMVSEVLQYFDESLKIKAAEADSLYAGIMLDTSNFLTRTGVRTLEAAAYLRRNGADVTRIRKLFRDTMDDCRAKATIIAQAEIFESCFAISECPSIGLKSPTVVSAQAANELLSVVGVKASFVLTNYNNMIYISARAIDEVNVQLIMERLGGGGHLNIAGAQLTEVSIKEARDLLKKTILEMREEGDI